MNKRLDDFIRSHREAFDNDEPSADVWNSISKRLKPEAQQTKVISMPWFKWAVAATIFATAGLIALFFLKQKPVAPPPGEIAKTERTKSDSILLNEINPAYAKELYHFTKLIEIKQEELKAIEKENPSLYQQFLEDINTLDSSYKALKKELPANPNREQLLEAMISNLQWQMDLLNQQLQIIQQIKQSKKTGNESNYKSI